ncbi:MAG: YunC family protein [Methanosarcinaceae archaeon]
MEFECMIIEQVKLTNGTALCLKFDMQNAPLLVIKANKGFVMCGYLDIEMAEVLGDVAVKVKGVNTFEDVLEAQVVATTQAATNLGIDINMNARNALERMF